MVGINAFISTNTINAPVIQSTDIVAVSILEAAAHCKKKQKTKKGGSSSSSRRRTSRPRV